MKMKMISLLTAVIMVLSLVVTGKGTAWTSGAHAATPNLNDYSAEEVFKALMFGQGELTKEIPALYPGDEWYDEVNSEESVQITDQIAGEVNNLDSLYMESLKEAVHSGKPNAIKEQLERGTILVHDALDALGYDLDVSAYAEGVGVNAVIGITVFVVVVAAVHTAAAVTHTAAGAVQVYLAGAYVQVGAVTTSSIEATEEKVLAFEELVKDVATTFQ